MGNVIVIGTAALLIALGLSHDTASAANTNVPSWSPYAIMPQANGDALRGRAHSYHYVHNNVGNSAAPQWADVGLPEYMTGDYSNYF
jgi:hypothetical protein